MTSKYLQSHAEETLQVFPRINSQDSSNSIEQNVLTEDNLTDENDEEIEDRPNTDPRLKEENQIQEEVKNSLKRTSSYSMWRLLDNSDDEGEGPPPNKKVHEDQREPEKDFQDIAQKNNQTAINFDKINSLLASAKFLNAQPEKEDRIPFYPGQTNFDVEAFKNIISSLMSKRQQVNTPMPEPRTKPSPMDLPPTQFGLEMNMPQFGQNSPFKATQMGSNPYLLFNSLMQQNQPYMGGHLSNLMNILNQNFPMKKPGQMGPALGRMNPKKVPVVYPLLENLSQSLLFRNAAGKMNGKNGFPQNEGKGFSCDEIQHRMNQTPAVRDTNSLLASAQLAAACNSDNFGLTCTLTPVHLRKAKLMFFYVRYPNSSLLKVYFPDVRFNKNNTAQLVKWFSNFREFYYIQMEKFARIAISDGVLRPDEIRVTIESELYRSLNLHYNRNQQIEVPEQFLTVVEATLKEFFVALSSGKDNEQSWKKPIYKIIARLDQPVPEFFKSPNWMNQLTEN